MAANRVVELRSPAGSIRRKRNNDRLQPQLLAIPDEQFAKQRIFQGFEYAKGTPEPA